MIKTWEGTEIGQEYARAYAVQYTDRNLREALKLYLTLISSHPDSEEAGYSRMQIQGIASKVVPKKELADAQVKLALANIQ